MPRSIAAYLADIVDACGAVEAALAGVDLKTYQETRALRSSVEREFILVGEAVAGIRRLDPQAAQGISHARSWAFATCWHTSSRRRRRRRGRRQRYAA